MTAIQIVDADSEPVTFNDVKKHSRITHDQDCSYIEALITAARKHCENICGRAFIEQTWGYHITCFSKTLTLPRPRLIGIDSIDYYDTNGVSQTLPQDIYQVDLATSSIFLAPGKSWPGVQDRPSAITIQFRSGFGASASSVPEPIKHAILLLVGHWYENREAVLIGTISKPVEFAVDALLAPYRVFK